MTDRITRTKTALIARLDRALSDMYHNATPAWLAPYIPEGLDNEFWEWFSSVASDEIAYIGDGLCRTDKEYNYQRKIGFQHNERYFYLVSRITEYFGKLYTWGRGGRTLAPQRLIRQRGGGSFSILSGDEFIDSSNERLSNMIQVIEAFNDYVKQWNSKENLLSMWRDYCDSQRHDEAFSAKRLRVDLKRLAKQARDLSGIAGDDVCNVLRAKISELRAQHKAAVARIAALNEILA